MVLIYKIFVSALYNTLQTIDKELDLIIGTEQLKKYKEYLN